jgi:hypothetical protein
MIFWLRKTTIICTLRSGSLFYTLQKGIHCWESNPFVVNFFVRWWIKRPTIGSVLKTTKSGIPAPQPLQVLLHPSSLHFQSQNIVTSLCIVSIKENCLSILIESLSNITNTSMNMQKIILTENSVENFLSSWQKKTQFHAMSDNFVSVWKIDNKKRNIKHVSHKSRTDANFSNDERD